MFGALLAAAAGARRLADHDAGRSAPRRSGCAPGCCRARRSTSRSAACRRSTSSTARCSACSACAACTCRPRAAARTGEITLPAVGPADVELLRARDPRAPRRRARAAGRRAARRAPAHPRRPAARRAHRRAARRDPAACSPSCRSCSRSCSGQRHPPRGRGGPAARARRRRPSGSSPRSRLLLLAWLLSIAGAVLAFAGFTVARDEDRLRLRRGLLSQREATVPVARIQAVRVIEGVLRRPFGLVTVRAEVAGYAKEAAAAQTLFPLLRRAEVRPFLDGVPARAGRRPRRAGGRPAAGAAALRPPDHRARRPRRGRRRLRGRAGRGALAAAGRRCPPPRWASAQWRAAGWRIRDGRTAFRSRRLAVVTVLAPAARLQEHGMRQTVLQRPRRPRRRARSGSAPRPPRACGTSTRPSPGGCSTRCARGAAAGRAPSPACGRRPRRPAAHHPRRPPRGARSPRPRGRPPPRRHPPPGG